MNLEPISWDDTKSRLRADRARLENFLRAAGRSGSVLLHPSMHSVTLQRVSHYFFRRGHRFIARFFWQLNFLLTGADLGEDSDFEGGLVIVNPCGMSITAKAGHNLTLMPLAGLGAEIGRNEDIGAGPGLPVLGDDVTLEPHSGVLGPVRIGSRVLIRGLTLVVKDVPDDTVVEGSVARFVPRRDVGNV